MFKAKGFNSEDKSAQAANAFEQATQSVILQQAMANVQKERRGKSRDDISSSTKNSIQTKGTSDLSAHNTENQSSRAQNEGDDDDFFDDEEESDFRMLREQRLQALKNQRRELQENIIKGHGKYEEVVEEDFLKAVTGSKYCVCAFYHRDFERCKIVDMHLAQLAPKHLPTRFIKIDAEKAKFFVGKLTIRMLPTIVCFVDGVAVDRVVGFGELGERDDFKTVVLEARLEQAGVVARAETVKQFKMEQQRKKQSSAVQRRSQMDWD